MTSAGVFLETERLLLRRFTEADIPNLVELDGDPEVMRFINGGRPTPREEVEGVAENYDKAGIAEKHKRRAVKNAYKMLFP